MERCSRNTLTTIIIITTIINSNSKVLLEVQPEVLQRCITFHPDQLKSVQENETKRFYFPFLL